MATPLDLGLLANVGVIFPFLLVLVFSYAILSKIQIFGKDQNGLNAFISFVLAVITLFSPIATKTIAVMAPWFVLLFIFMIFLLIAYQAMGVKESTITDLITSSEHGDTFFYWVIALVLIIGLGSLSAVISSEKGFTKLTTGENQTTVAEPNEDVGFFQTLVHPKVLGLMLLLLIAMFTVRNLTKIEPAGK